MNPIRRWLLQRLGVLTWLDELTQLAGRAIAAEDRRDRWRARAEDAERLTLAYAEVFDQIVDPTIVNGVCPKVRCYSRELADKQARLVERQLGLEPQSMEPYSCRRCGIQPITNEPWWHITNVAILNRGGRNPRKRKTARTQQQLGDDATREALHRKLFG